MEGYLNTKEAAEFLGVAQVTLKTWRLNDKGPAFERREYGRARVVYKRATIEQFKRDNMGGE